MSVFAQPGLQAWGAGAQPAPATLPSTLDLLVLQAQLLQLQLAG